MAPSAIISASDVTRLLKLESGSSGSYVGDVSSDADLITANDDKVNGDKVKLRKSLWLSV